MARNTSAFLSCVWPAPAPTGGSWRPGPAPAAGGSGSPPPVGAAWRSARRLTPGRCRTASRPRPRPWRRSFTAGAQPDHRVRELLLLGEPAEELLQGPELVAGVRFAVPRQQVDQPPLHVVADDLVPRGAAGAGIRWAPANQAT